MSMNMKPVDEAEIDQALRQSLMYLGKGVSLREVIAWVMTSAIKADRSRNENAAENLKKALQEARGIHDALRATIETLRREACEKTN